MVSSRFTFYPLFRLSVALATGIFLSDVFALDGTYLYALCFVCKHSKKCTFYTLRFGCSFAAVNTIKPQLL